VEFRDEEDGRVSLIMDKEELPLTIEALMRAGYGLAPPSDAEAEEPEGPEAEADEPEADEPEGPEAEADEPEGPEADEEPEADEPEGPDAEADEPEDPGADEPEDLDAEEPSRGSPIRRRRARAGR
jgi:hypothetical protein